MDELYSIEEFLIGIKRVFDYIGPEKFSELIKGDSKKESRKEKISNEEILERIRNRK